MTTYSYAQLEGLWINAGGSQALAPTMAAIAMAESGGDSNAYNASGATGLWQILGAVNSADQSNLKDPGTNAKEAVLKYKSQGLGAWVTYTTGAYKQFLKSGVQAIGVSGTSADTTTNAQDASSGSNCCAVGFGGVSTGIGGLIPGVPSNVGGFCLLSKTQVNSLVGLLIISAGALVGTVGLTWILVYTFKKSGALNTVASAAVPELGAITSAAGLAQQVQKHTPNRASSSGGGRQAAPRKPSPETPEPLEIPVPKPRKQRTTRP